MRLDRLTENLLIVFLGLSCVFWLPGIPVAVLSAVKSGCLFGGGALAVYLAIRRGTAGVPLGLVGLVGILAIVLASVPAFVQADAADAMRWGYNYAIAFTSMTVLFMFARAGGDVLRVLRGSALLLSALVVLAFLAGVTNFDGVVSPAEYGSRTIRENGFASSRASWSVGLAVFLPLVVAVLTERFRTRRTVWNLGLLILVTVSFLGTQILSGGRTGLLASLCVLTLLVWRLTGRLTALVLLGGVSIAAYLNLDFLSTQLRLTRGTSALSLDEVSSGRLEGFELAWASFWERPFIGHGFGVIHTQTLGGIPVDIHNLWLALLADGGLLLTVVMTVFLAGLLWRAWPLFQAGVPVWQAAPLVLLAAYIACLLEPAVLFGAFQATALFWFVAGLVRAGSVAGDVVPEVSGDDHQRQVVPPRGRQELTL